MNTVDRFIDVNKHMTTLGAGAVVLIGTFMKDIFPKTKAGELDLSGYERAILGFSLGCFGATVFIAVTVMSLAAGGPSDTLSTVHKNLLSTATFIAVYAFTFGILLFGWLVYGVIVNVP